jgi:hypothetical protein
MRPDVSVVISSFGVHQPSWHELRVCLQAIAAQDVNEQVEVILVDIPGLSGDPSDDFLQQVPKLRLISCDSRDPWARRTAGAREATSPLIVFLDADCVPETGWLRSMLEVFRFFPEVAIVRGPVEEDGIAWRRLLLSDRPVAGPVNSTAENNIAFRREAYLDYPFPVGMGGQAIGLQTAALRRAHYVIWSEPGMQSVRGRAPRKLPVTVRIRYSTAASR